MEAHELHAKILEESSSKKQNARQHVLFIQILGSGFAFFPVFLPQWIAAEPDLQSGAV